MSKTWHGPATREAVRAYYENYVPPEVRLRRIREAAELCLEHLRQHDNGQALIDAIFEETDR